MERDELERRNIPGAISHMGMGHYIMEEYHYFSGGNMHRARCSYCPYVTTGKGCTEHDAFKCVRDHLKAKHGFDAKEMPPEPGTKEFSEWFDRNKNHV